MRVWVHDREFLCSLRGYAWQRADGLQAVDGTLEIEARSVQQGTPDFLGLIHGRLVRASPDAPFTVPLSLEELGEWVQHPEGSASEHGRVRVPDARFRILSLIHI